MIERLLQKHIEKNLFQGKVIILYGARRVGKTTLSKQLLSNYESQGKSTAYFNCESLKVRGRIETTDETKLYDFFKTYNLVVLDEAQSIENIGLILKILHDSHPEIQIIATGSSSFDIANKLGEPLVGRARTFTLYPFAIGELKYDLFKLDSNLENFLKYGLYPAVITSDDRVEELQDIVNGFLYKDILALDGIKNSRYLTDLLKILALQVGSEVSYNEIANTLGMTVATVIKYIDLLEKFFVIFTLPALTRNLRNEVGKKTRKVYFYDLGIRNTIINNYNELDIRNDIGALWENFCIVELIKKRENIRLFANQYYWRTYEQQEIDYIEEYNGQMHAYEFKFNEKAKIKIPKSFCETYQANVNVVNKGNYYQFLCS